MGRFVTEFIFLIMFIYAIKAIMAGVGKLILIILKGIFKCNPHKSARR